MVKKIGAGWCVLCLGSLMLTGCTSGTPPKMASARGPFTQPTANNARPAFNSNTPGTNNVSSGTGDPQPNFPSVGPVNSAPVVGTSSTSRLSTPTYSGTQGIPNAPFPPNGNLPSGPYNGNPSLSPELTPAGSLAPAGGLSPTSNGPALRPTTYTPSFPTPPGPR